MSIKKRVRDCDATPYERDNSGVLSALVHTVFFSLSLLNRLSQIVSPASLRGRGDTSSPLAAAPFESRGGAPHNYREDMPVVSYRIAPLLVLVQATTGTCLTV